MNVNPKAILVNFLTAIRIVLSIYFVKKTNYYFSDLGLLGLIFFTDFLDGYLARKLNATTSFGREFDQISDKLIFYMLYYKLIHLGYGQYLYLILFMLRDVCMTTLRIARYNVKWLKTGNLNKAKTFFQFLIIFLSFYALISNMPSNGLLSFI